MDLNNYDGRFGWVFEVVGGVGALYNILTLLYMKVVPMDTRGILGFGTSGGFGVIRFASIR